METITQQTNLLERFNKWIGESITIKLFSIGFLVLILLIPAGWIEDTIAERQQRAGEVIEEVTDKWSGSQTVSGPVLVIPYRIQEVVDKGQEGTEVREKIAKAFFLPEQLTVNGSIKPEILHRGIFDAVVYESDLQIKSSFTRPDFKSLSIPDEMVLWSGAYISFGVTDLRGISDNPKFLNGLSALAAEPSNNIGVSIRKRNNETDIEKKGEYSDRLSTSGMVAKLNWDSPEAFNGTIDASLKLKGSQRLHFVPVGKTTAVNLTSPWNDPSFDGEFLPSSREITDKGFQASWNVLHFNRPFSQQWTGSGEELGGSDFGVRLLIPVDQYQKSIRTSKYGVLIILLTFVALFLVEITQKVRIHPFQYILIGAALIIYYTLLLSISEHTGYNIAYMIASAATVVLLGLYSSTFLRDKRLVLLFSLLVATFYAFVFTIILQQDLSLLIGSIGLFLIVSLLMFFSRKINWYRQANA